MIGPGSSGGGAGCGSIEPRAPRFQIRGEGRGRGHTPADSAALPDQEAGSDHNPNRDEAGHGPVNDTFQASLLEEKRGPPEGGVVVGSEEGERESGTPAGLASHGIITTRFARDTRYTGLS